MPKTIQQCREITEQRTKQILSHALKLFYEEGFENVSVDLICKKMRISHGLFYYYFNSKEDLQEKIFEQSNQFSTELETLIKSNLSGIAYIEAINSLVVKTIDGDLLTCYFIYYLLKDGFLCKKEKACDRLEFKALKRILPSIKEGQQKRQVVPGEPEEIFFTYISSLYGLSSFKMKTKKKESFSVPDKDVLMNIFYRKERPIL